MPKRSYTLSFGNDSNQDYDSSKKSKNIDKQVQEMKKDMMSVADMDIFGNDSITIKDNHILPIPGTRSISHLKEMIKGASLKLTDEHMAEIEKILPVGWAYGDRYSVGQWIGPEKYC